MDPSTSNDATDSPASSGSTGAGDVDELLARMRRDLTEAMRARDKVRVGAIRTTLAAIANAEAPPIADAPSSAAEPVVGRLQEHTRLVLTVADVDRILRHEIADRTDTAAQFDAHGRAAEAGTVRTEVAVLAEYLR